MTTLAAVLGRPLEDHLLAGPAVAERISAVSVDPAWATEGPLPSGLADHAPIRFTVSG